MSEIEQVFQVLLYGEGFWLGFIIIMSICLLVANRLKYSSSIFCVVMIFLAVDYNANIDGSSNKMWGVALCFIGVMLLCLQLSFDLKNR